MKIAVAKGFWFAGFLGYLCVWKLYCWVKLCVFLYVCRLAFIELGLM